MTGDRDRDRFAEIYDAFSGLILAYAIARTTDPADAADVVAEVFTVAWRRLDDVPAGDEVRPWLYGVARNVLRNHHRARRRRWRLDERLATQIVAVIEPAVSEVDGPDGAAIGAAFRRLCDRDRELLALAGWDQLSTDEIATVLGVNRSTVRLRLHRARKRFESALADEGVKRATTTGQGSGGWAHALPDPEEA